MFWGNNNGRITEINTLMKVLTEVTHVIVNNTVFINELSMFQSVN
jgi:putative salt-induced outer membrane protein YdiY